MTIEDGKAEPVEDPCPHCGERQGMQTYVKIKFSGVRKASYIPGAIECQNDDCPGPPSEFGNTWVRP
jgi:hypothetical protein